AGSSPARPTEGGFDTCDRETGERHHDGRGGDAVIAVRLSSSVAVSVSHPASSAAVGGSSYVWWCIARDRECHVEVASAAVPRSASTASASSWCRIGELTRHRARCS